MSSEVINDTVDFFSYPYTAELSILVDTFRNPSGKVPQTFTFDGHDYMTYTIPLNTMDSTDRDTLHDFVMAMQGPANNFLLQDTYGFGYQVARQSIGTGDGADATWQLKETRTVGSQSTSYNRWDIISGSVSVWVAGALKTETTHYTVDYRASGIVTFTGGNIPTLGQNIEAAFNYYRRVRFGGSFKNILRACDSNSMQLVMIEENASA